MNGTGFPELLHMKPSAHRLILCALVTSNFNRRVNSLTCFSYCSAVGQCSAQGCWPQSSGCWPCALRKPQESANSDQVRGLQEYVPSAVGVEAPYPALGQRMPCLLNPSLPKLSLSMSWPSISVHPQPQLHLQFQRCLVLGCLIVIVPQTNLQYRK